MMKKLLKLFLFLLCFSACSQNTKKQNTKTMSTEQITSRNFVEKVLQQVKHYDKEPTYWLRISKDYKSELEIFVNDMPVYKDYDPSKGYSTSEEVNYVILKSGVQNVRYKLSSGEKERYVKINVVQADKKGSMEIEDEVSVRPYEKTVRMPPGGVYEESFTFEARVPYENRGWSDGQDLTKFDRKELDAAVAAFYRRMWDIYNDKSKKEAQFPLIMTREFETAQSLYEDESGLKENLDIYLRPYTNATYDLQPLENYNLKLFGNGKVVVLQQKSTDIRLRGKLALWAKYQLPDEKTIRTSFPNLFLYLPPGKSLKDGLEIIR